jgi:diacylglycerol kinase
MPPRSPSLKGRLRSVACAVRGIAEMVRSQPNARIHAVATVSAVLHPIAGKAKDVAAGAVLIAAVGSAVIGLLVFGPHIWRWWRLVAV